MWKHVPNLLTLSRILLIPVFIAVFYLPLQSARLLAAIIFIIAALTDWFDGYLARRLQLTSSLGAFLDPVADKLLVATALVLIVAEGPTYLAIPATIIIGREIAISALREWMAELGKRKEIAVNILGKIKTAVQMFALILLIIHDPRYHNWFGILAYSSLYLAAALTLWSMALYARAVWREISTTLL